MFGKKEYNKAIEAAAEVAYNSYMETICADPKVNAEEAEEKARYIVEQILNLKND